MTKANAFRPGVKAWPDPRMKGFCEPILRYRILRVRLRQPLGRRHAAETAAVQIQSNVLQNRRPHPVYVARIIAGRHLSLWADHFL
jgi:hypothetical protein